MRVINELIPTTDYMQAENACTLADAKERKEYGESSGLLSDLRSVKDNMMADAQSLAESIAHLQREVAYATTGSRCLPMRASRRCSPTWASP